MSTSGHNPYDPYSSPANSYAPVQHMGPAGDPSASQITMYAILNFVFAGPALIMTVLLGGTLVYGIFYSGDPPEEIMAGVSGSVVIGLPGLLGLVVFPTAGIGLLKRSTIGYYAHFVGAIIMAFSCLGIVYTVFALMHATQPAFRAHFFKRGSVLCCRVGMSAGP